MKDDRVSAAILLVLLVLLVLILGVGSSSAQTIPPARLAILQAEERGARETRDLSAIRSGVRSSDSETARVAVRALGRLRRPALVADITPALKSALPEIRAEAANAIAQALTSPAVVTAAALDSALTLLANAVNVDEDSNVRAAMLDALGRLPYGDLRHVERAEAVLLTFAQSAIVMDRLGVAKGFEALIRLQEARWQPSPAAVEALRYLFGVAAFPSADSESRAVTQTRNGEASQDTRVRRLALEALTTARAVEPSVLDRAAADTDPQVRRLGMLAAQLASASGERADAMLRAGVGDPSAMVRIEALNGLSQRYRGEPASCQPALDATHDQESHVAAAAFRALRECGTLPQVVGYLEQVIEGHPERQVPRGWVRAVHAFDTLTRVAPDRARALLESMAASETPQLRLYAVGAAALVNDRECLTRLAGDDAPAIRSAALSVLGYGSAAKVNGRPTPVASDLNAADLRRLAAPRARVTVRDVGVFELVLVTTEAPAAVLRFARLAEGGSFDGMMLAALATSTALVNLNPVDAGADQAPARAMSALHLETGSWPHVRGTVGLSSDGAATGGAQLFINLVDRPRFDHQLTVFAQVLSGIDVVDRLLPGDIVEKVEILP
jgi:peptidyl-prolyl cis-trans isomerase B (cyclophilin B)